MPMIPTPSQIEKYERTRARFEVAKSLLPVLLMIPGSDPQSAIAGAWKMADEFLAEEARSFFGDR